jgi:methyltransferase (TIGR00027 family)
MDDTLGRPSRTAAMMAAARALHREEPPPWLIDDALALPLAGEDGETFKQRLRAELPEQALLGFSRWACVRARLPEDVVEQALDEGVRQYAILGAGLDSFAYRRSDLLPRLRVFEVDHPATQQWKRRRLADLGVALPANLVFAPVDFERQTLRMGLADAGFDFAAPAVFSWIGVTMYLTLGAIRSTLELVRSCPSGTRIVLTYNLPLAALQGMGHATESAMQRIVGELGEPMVSLFTPAEIEQLLRDLGFTTVEHVGPEEALQRYFPGRTDVRFGGAQRIVVGTVGA